MVAGKSMTCHTHAQTAWVDSAAAHSVRPEQNHLLAALSAAERERLFPVLKKVRLPLGSVLYEAGDTPRYIYFPTDCTVSILNVLKNGASTGIAAVGNESAVGAALFPGGETMTNRAVVQGAGFAYRLTSARLEHEFARHGELFNVLLRCAQALITQMAQTVVCNRHHSVDQQLCRWLLVSLDRQPSTELTMTQQLIASILGVRREGVSEAAGKLQQQGLIHYRRGHITVLDRPRLEQLSCECYGVVKRETDRLLPHVRQPESVRSLTLTHSRNEPAPSAAVSHEHG
jgi:CRP-like cAMP-binding protein